MYLSKNPKIMLDISLLLFVFFKICNKHFDLYLNLKNLFIIVSKFPLQFSEVKNDHYLCLCILINHLFD